MNKNLFKLDSDLGTTAKSSVLETVIAVNIETKTPMPSVRAKPLTAAVPSQKRMAPVMIEETLESRIESQARLKPSWNASDIFLPFFNSSFARSKMSTLASTAIPIERMNPARPAAVRVTGMSLKIVRERTI